MKNIVLLILIFAIAGCGLGKAFDYAKADSAYLNKNYEEAVSLYSEAINREGVSAGLLYNLGNAYYSLGKDGEAMICYERAKKLAPGNTEINQNLNYLATKVTEANKGELKGKAGNVEPDQGSFLDNFYEMIAIDTQSNNWAVFAIMAFILFLCAMALYMFTPNVLARKTGFFSGLVFLGFTVVFIIFAFIGAREYTRADKAILMDFTTQLKDQPAETSKASSIPLHKGTKIMVLESKKGEDGNEWLKVKLNSDNVGWVKKEKLEII